MELTDAMIVWLERIERNGHWPDRPFLNDPVSVPLMRAGLVEVVKPHRHLSYATITRAGIAALRARGARP